MVGSRRRQGNGREQVRFGGDRDPAAGEKGRRVDRRYLREACCDGTGGEAAGEGDVDLGAVVPRHGCCGVRTRRTGGGGGEETNRGMQWSAVAPAPRSQQHQASRPAGGRGWRKKKSRGRAEERSDSGCRRGRRSSINRQQDELELVRRLGLGFRRTRPTKFPLFFPFFAFFFPVIL